MDPSSQSAAPADSDAQELAQELGHDLMSPYCPGRTIASCPTQAARDLEADILAQAKAGQTREDIEAELVGRFGADIIGYRGDPIVIYGSVVTAVIAAFVLGWAGQRWVRRSRSDASRSGSGSAEAEPPGPSRRDLDRLEDALDDIDEF